MQISPYFRRNHLTAGSFLLAIPTMGAIFFLTSVVVIGNLQTINFYSYRIQWWRASRARDVTKIKDNERQCNAMRVTASIRSFIQFLIFFLRFGIIPSVRTETTSWDKLKIRNLHREHTSLAISDSNFDSLYSHTPYEVRFDSELTNISREIDYLERRAAPFHPGLTPRVSCLTEKEKGCHFWNLPNWIQIANFSHPMSLHLLPSIFPSFRETLVYKTRHVDVTEPGRNPVPIFWTRRN